MKMRLFLLLILTIPCVPADYVCTCREIPSNPDEESDEEAYSKVLSEKVTKENLQVLKKSFGEANLKKTFTKLREMSRQHPFKEPTTEQKKEIKQKLEKYGEIKLEKPSPDAMVNQFEINAKSGVAEFLFEGDVFATPEELEEMEKLLEGEMDGGGRKRRSAAVAQARYKWTNAIVPYKILGEVKSKPKKMAAFNGAIKFIQDNTCIRFREDPTAAKRIDVENGAGCYAAVGMTGSKQSYSLGDGCELIGIAAHELLHTLGFYHTQSRDDRDSYVTINANSFPADKAHNFAKYKSTEVINYTPYEYGSTMHYGANFFASRNDLISILPKDDRYLYTQGGNLLSFYDMKMLNIHYDCLAKCPVTTSAKCKNGGYINPNNCQECVCPYGYGGTLCDQRPSGCGAELTATTSWIEHSFKVGDQTTDRVDYNHCIHWIKAPAGAKIKVKVTNMLNSFCSFGCSFAALEFKMDDQERTNPRICCKTSLNVEFTSKLNPLPVMSYNRHHVTDFTIQYKYEGGEVPPVPVNRTTTTTRQTTTTRAARATTKKTVVIRECRDRDTNCLDLKRNRGFCDPVKNQFRYRKYSCAKTCGLCGQNDSPCRDYLENNRCRSYIQEGKCLDMHYAEMDCPKTCGLCENPI